MQVDYKIELDKILKEDLYGLLVVKPKSSSTISSSERLISSFKEINTFIKENGRHPDSINGQREHSLYARLNGFRENNEKIAALQPYDEFKLLEMKQKKIETIDDILDDNLGLLDSDADSIFKVRDVLKITTMPDYVATRKPCKNFKDYEDLFKNCQSDLHSGQRKLRIFTREQQIEKGSFFVLKGILLYIDAVGEREVVNNKSNARLRCIFENGTESDMLLRSLSAELYKDGRRVTTLNDELLEDFENVTAKDASTGFIYILRSLSDNQKIKEIPHLYKIGFSTVPVEERIKNASQEPTYLNAAVSVIAVYQCYNLNPQKLEQLLHTFFGSACLNIDVYDANGTRFTPREWFVAPLEFIEQAVTLLINGEIINYKYDPEKMAIELKPNVK
jgi:hypothetical protein